MNPCSQADYPARTAAYTGTAGTTATWNPGPELVLVWADTDCYVEVGAGAVATTASTPLPAGVPCLFKLPLGLSAPWVVSAIRITASGNVYAKPANRG